jgi:pimeloyl-ACP methyl ester carboxylesterase
MATFVLVHGAWAGGWAWMRVMDRLVSKGHRVFAPTLSGLGERSHLAGSAINLTTHINDVVNEILWKDLDDLVLVGHSYGGAVITNGATGNASASAPHVHGGPARRGRARQPPTRTSPPPAGRRHRGACRPSGPDARNPHGGARVAATAARSLHHLQAGSTRSASKIGPIWQIDIMSSVTEPATSTASISSRSGAGTERSTGSCVDLSAPSGTLRLLLDLVCDRERDLVLLDARVENLVIEERSRLPFEEDAGSLFFDHLVILGRQRNDVQMQVRLRPGPLGDHPQATCLRDLVGGRDDVLHGLNRAVGECEQRAHLLPGWFGRSRPG